MKSLITLFILVICIYNMKINAQNFYEKNTISSGNEVFNCISLSHDSKMCIIENVKNKLYNVKMIIPNKAGGLSAIDPNNLVDKKIVSIVQDVIPVEGQLKLKKAKEKITITYYINDSGRVLELTFLLNKNSIVKPQYLAKIEQRIKNEVVFTFASNELKGANFLRFSKSYWF